MIFFTSSIFAVSFPHAVVPLGHPVYGLIENLELRKLMSKSGDVRPYTRGFVTKQLESAKASNSLSVEETQYIEAILDSFDDPESNSQEDVLYRGSILSPSLLSEQGSVELGVRLGSQFTLPASNSSHFDSRNELSGFLRGDITEYSTFQIEMGGRYDLLNTSAWAPYHFITPGEGQYIVYSEDGNTDSRGQEDFAFNFLLAPEITISLLDDKLNIRWGMFERDWGVGDGNLNISKNARSFDAIEGKMDITSWMRYYYLTGTLTAPKILASAGGYGRPDQYQNMLTTKRLEFYLPTDLTFSLYETVMWPKRLELGYLNPFMVTTIYQNTLGDYDNMFAGFDFSWGLTESTEVYGSFMIDETQTVNPLNFFTDPRSIFGLQAGAKQHVPFLPFLTLSLQYTRLEPFFYTHRPLSHPSYDNEIIEQDLSYTNKLENLGYYLSPNSDEIKLSIDTFPAESVQGRLEVAYIRHSDQYGDEMDEYMDYGIDNSGGYADKDFSAHIVEHTIIPSITGKMNIPDSPISLQFSYTYYASFNRASSDVNSWDFDQDHLVSLKVNVFSD
jgi:hypothetical protein